MRPQTPFISALGFALVAASVVVALALLARGLEPLIEAGWLGLEDPDPLEQLAIRWVSWFAMSLLSYVLVATAARALTRAPSAGHITLLRRFLGFQTLIAWFLVLQYYSLAVVGADGGPELMSQTQVLLVSSLASVLWPITGGELLRRRTVQSVFLTSAVSLGLCAVVLDRWILQGWAVSLGLVAPPKSILISHDFLTYLPFVACVPALLWELARLSRGNQLEAEARVQDSGGRPR